MAQSNGQTVVPAWKQTLDEKAEVFYATFGPHNPEGQKCLEVMSETFQQGGLLSDDSLKMAYNVGQYELVEYIKTMIKVAQNG